MDELIVSLDVGLKGINEKIPDINGGGCGVFALLLWDELCQLDMIPQPVVFTDKKVVWSIYHVALKWDGIYFDSEGARRDIEEAQYAIEQEMPLDVLQVEAYDGSLWSDRFNREYIPQLKKEIRALGAKVLKQKRQMELLTLNMY